MHDACCMMLDEEITIKSLKIGTLKIVTGNVVKWNNLVQFSNACNSVYPDQNAFFYEHFEPQKLKLSKTLGL